MEQQSLVQQSMLQQSPGMLQQLSELPHVVQPRVAATIDMMIVGSRKRIGESFRVGCSHNPCALSWWTQDSTTVVAVLPLLALLLGIDVHVVIA